MGSNIRCRRHEVILWRHFQDAMFARIHMRVVVIVPGRNGIDHLISRVYQCFEDRIDDRTAAAGYLYLLIAEVNIENPSEPVSYSLP